MTKLLLFVQRPLTLAIFAGLVVLNNAHAATDSGLTKDLVALSSDESGQEDALKRLKGQPQANLIKSLKGMLSSPATVVFALRAIQQLEIAGLESDVASKAKTSSSPEVIDSANTLIDAGKSPELVRAYRERLYSLAGTRKNSALKSALLSGLSNAREGITREQFLKLSADEDYLVRESVVQHFLLTRESLSNLEQTERFRTAFSLRPYQARKLAYEGFLALASKDKAALASAFSSSICGAEKNASVLKLCRGVEVAVKKGGKP